MSITIATMVSGSCSAATYLGWVTPPVSYATGGWTEDFSPFGKKLTAFSLTSINPSILPDKTIMIANSSIQTARSVAFKAFVMNSSQPHNTIIAVELPAGVNASACQMWFLASVEY